MNKALRPLQASKRDIQSATPRRNPYSSKKENGKVTIIGGSERYHGAPALASNAAYSALAALRVGIGYVVEYVPNSVANSTRSVSPNIIVVPLPSNNLSIKGISKLERDLVSSQCIVLGPGLGREKGTIDASMRIIRYALKNKKRTVVDADAIYALSSHKIRLNMGFVLTMNNHEMHILYNKSVNENNANSRISAAMHISNSLNCNVLLKGHETIVTDGERVKMIKSKSSALATMGTGDVLSGMIGAYAANCKDMFIATTAGAYLHSIIGDALHKEKGNHILASDVVDYIPRVLRKFDRGA